MLSSATAETVLATIGTICWSGQLIPQIFKTWRTKSIDGLSPYLVLIWGFGGFFLGVYAIVQRLNIVLILQPHLSTLFCLISWGQCLYYGNPERGAWRATLIMGSVMTVMSAFEVGMVYAVTPSYNRGSTGPTQFFGYASAVFIAVGLLPQYYEIYTLRQVIGISLTFMTIDMLGGVFLDLSLAFSKNEFDVVPSITYSIVVVMDAAVLIAAAILNPLKRRKLLRERNGEIEACIAAVGNSNPPVEGAIIMTQSEGVLPVPVSVVNRPLAGT